MKVKGVSRQAVSKWDSNQSAPDIENIIIVSDYFKVATDYLLKGIEHEPEEKAKMYFWRLLWGDSTYPQLSNSLKAYGLCWIIYFLICIVIDVIIIFRYKNSQKGTWNGKK